MSDASGILGQAWRALGGDPARLDRVRETGLPRLPAVLPAARLIHDAIAAAALAAEELAGDDGVIAIDPARAATAVTSERWFRERGGAPDVWSPFSGFRRAADGWVRTHANYPHHRERLLRALDLPAGAVPAELADRIRSLPARDVEGLAERHGALAVAVRRSGEWARSPQGLAAAEEPLLRLERADAPIGWRPAADASRDAVLAGLRVLDLTRVIAGPVAGRTLALLGAEVLRIDPPAPAEPHWQHLDTGHGKRSALLDVRSDDGAARFEQLLGEAHVLLLGYRPGSFDAAGIAARHPGLVIAELSAWGWSGPWAGRRGFDSLVQAASGIALLEGDADAPGESGHPDETPVPGALPAQALDHSTGYLLAAAVLRALTEGRGVRVRASLARTAAALLDLPREPVPPPAAFEPTVTELGDVTTAAPAFGPRSWPRPPRPWGGDAPAWR